MLNKSIFKDRSDGGKKLAEKLKFFNFKNPIVLAVPQGGIPVGYEISKELKIPFDLVISRKPLIPGSTDAGFGGCDPSGNCILNPHMVSIMGLTDIEIDRVIKETKKEVKAQKEKYRGDKKFPSLKGRSAIIVDDGLAGGYTMLAAVEYILSKDADKVIVAIPTAPFSGIQVLNRKPDKIVSLYIHPESLPYAVGASYEQYDKVGEDEAMKCVNDLKKLKLF